MRVLFGGHGRYGNDAAGTLPRFDGTVTEYEGNGVTSRHGRNDENRTRNSKRLDDGANVGALIQTPAGGWTLTKTCGKKEATRRIKEE